MTAFDRSGRGVRRVVTRDEFHRFRALLTSTGRRPVVVVTVPPGANGPAIDVDALVDQIGGAAHLCVLSAEAAFWLTGALGKDLSVHSGWARVYPASQRWRTETARAPRIRPVAGRGRRTVHQIVDAVLDAAFRDGRIAVEAAPVARAGERTVAVVADRLSATQVLVRTAAGGQALLRTHHLAPGLPAEMLVSRGQRFAGRVTPVGIMGEFVPDPIVDDPVERATDFVGDGIVTSARVDTVAPEQVVVRLHPDVPVRIAAERGEDLTMLATEGDVVTVELICLDGQFVASFSAEEPEPAMAMLPGGPPWLRPDQAASEAGAPPEPDRGELGRDEPYRAQTVGAQTVGARAAVMDIGARSSAGRHDIEALEEELESREEQLRQARGTIRSLQRDLRNARRLTAPVVYRDPDRQFRFEVQLDYLTRVDQANRSRFPWPREFAIGPDFLASVDELVAAGGISRAKIVEVCTDVLCGRAKEMPSRCVKVWKSSSESTQVAKRADGGTAMRVRLQTGRAAARRMRYWVLPDGTIELDRVAVHDAGI